jgi:hypothetical protein
MVFKLVMAAAKTWRRLKGKNQIAQGRPGRHLHQRRRGHQHASAERRLITPSPRLLHSSRRVFEPGACQSNPHQRTRYVQIDLLQVKQVRLKG